MVKPMDDLKNQAYDFDIESLFCSSDDPLEEINELTLKEVFVAQNQISIKIGEFEENKNILIVEDDCYVANDYGVMLTGYGFNVSYAYNTEQALKIVYYQGKCFSFIILDIRMEHGKFFTPYETSNGECTGALLCHEVLEYAPDAKIVALTNSTNASIEAWFENNVNHRFCKKLEYPPEIFCQFIQLLSSRYDETIDKSKDNEMFSEQLKKILKPNNQTTIDSSTNSTLSHYQS